MSASAVLDAMAALDAAGIRAWIGGGWRVDALLGEQTRVHRDLDLAIGAEEVAPAIDASRSLRRTTDQPGPTGVSRMAWTTGSRPAK